MNDVKQVLRYSVPGWVFILVFYVFLLVTRVFIPPCLKNNFFNDFFFSLNLTDKVESNSLLTAGGLLVSGIPIGFILSQFYYYFMNLFGDNMIIMFPDMFKDIMIDVKHNIELKDPNSNKEISVKYLNKNNSIYFGYITYYLRCKFGKDNENIKREQDLSDMSHGLGASYYSIIMAFALYSILLSIYYYSFIFFSPMMFFYISKAFDINFIIASILVLIFYKNRRNIALQQIIILKQLADENNTVEEKDKNEK